MSDTSRARASGVALPPGRVTSRHDASAVSAVRPRIQADALQRIQSPGTSGVAQQTLEKALSSFKTQFDSPIGDVFATLRDGHVDSENAATLLPRALESARQKLPLALQVANRFCGQLKENSAYHGPSDEGILAAILSTPRHLADAIETACQVAEAVPASSQFENELFEPASSIAVPRTTDELLDILKRAEVYVLTTESMLGALDDSLTPEVQRILGPTRADAVCKLAVTCLSTGLQALFVAHIHLINGSSRHFEDLAAQAQQQDHFDVDLFLQQARSLTGDMIDFGEASIEMTLSVNALMSRENLDETVAKGLLETRRMLDRNLRITHAAMLRHASRGLFLAKVWASPEFRGAVSNPASAETFHDRFDNVDAGQLAVDRNLKAWHDHRDTLAQPAVRLHVLERLCQDLDALQGNAQSLADDVAAAPATRRCKEAMAYAFESLDMAVEGARALLHAEEGQCVEGLEQNDRMRSPDAESASRRHAEVFVAEHFSTGMPADEAQSPDTPAAPPWPEIEDPGPKAEPSVAHARQRKPRYRPRATQGSGAPTRTAEPGLPTLADQFASLKAELQDLSKPIASTLSERESRAQALVDSMREWVNGESRNPRSSASIDKRLREVLALLESRQGELAARKARLSAVRQRMDVLLERTGGEIEETLVSAADVASADITSEIERLGLVADGHRRQADYLRRAQEIKKFVQKPTRESFMLMCEWGMIRADASSPVIDISKGSRRPDYLREIRLWLDPAQTARYDGDRDRENRVVLHLHRKREQGPDLWIHFKRWNQRREAQSDTYRGAVIDPKLGRNVRDRAIALPDPPAGTWDGPARPTVLARRQDLPTTF
jgi:hypothetical protein